MTITLNGTTGITTPDITSSGALGVDASAPDNSLVVNSSGNVGIGTSSPTTNLEINGGTNNNIVRIVSTDANANIEFADNTTTSGCQIGANGDNIKFGISGTERMRIDSAGRVTMPYQPAFAAGFSTAQNLSSGQLCVFDTAALNIGSHYSTSTGRFTAPIAGTYQFQYSNNITRISGSWSGFTFRKNGSNYRRAYDDTSANWANISLSFIVYLNANDYIDIANADTSSCGHDGYFYGSFTGHLIG